ncbi:MAG: serine/threonine protein kinase [Phycisphaerales bacterium]|nr:serine/threonine protein kinase [Phycisphaerales bacterium]
MPPDSCLSEGELDRLGAGADATDAERLHLEACEHCRARVAGAKQDAAFLTRVRPLASAVLAPEGAPRVPGYRISGVVSAGTQGTVYRAMQESTSRTVAIKFVRTGDSHRQRMRAEREVEIAARLHHPNIVTVFESRALPGGSIVVVMEFVDGVPLDRFEPMATDRLRALLHVFTRVCEAIHYAHLNGVIHRDLKPDNILVTREGHPVVLDFGIAKSRGSHATITGEFAGTPAYASPEQASGKPDEVDGLSDVYALGVMLYQMACGSPPYELSGSIMEMARVIVEREPVPPRRANPGVAPDLEAIILRALRKRKEERYPSAAALGRDVERFLAGQPVEARSGSGWYLLRKALAMNARRIAWVGALGAVLALAGVLVAIGLANSAALKRRVAQQRELARAEQIQSAAVTEILREVLPATDPEHPVIGAAVSAGLRRLYFRLETGGLAFDPALDQATRRIWGSVYTSIGAGKAAQLAEYAEDSLRNGLIRLHIEHPEGDHPAIAGATFELAGILLVRGRLAEAEAAAKDAIAIYARLGESRGLPAARCEGLLARVLLAAKRWSEARDQAREAADLFTNLAGRDSDLGRASMEAAEAQALLMLGRAVDAEPLARRALARQFALLSPADPEQLESLVLCADIAGALPQGTLARELEAAWGPGDLTARVRADARTLAAAELRTPGTPQPRARYDALRRALALARNIAGDNDAVSVAFLASIIRAADDATLSVEWAKAAHEAADLLARLDDDPLAQLVCLEQAAALYALTGFEPESCALAARAVDILSSIPRHAIDPLVLANARRRAGWYLTIARRYDEAAPVLDQAAREIEAQVGTEHYLSAFARALIAFNQAGRGDAPGALARTERAWAFVRRDPTVPTDTLYHIGLMHGHLLVGSGRFEEGHDVLVEVWQRLRYDAGELRWAWRDLLIDDLLRCARALGDADDEARWQSEADKVRAGRTAELGTPAPPPSPHDAPDIAGEP